LQELIEWIDTCEHKFAIDEGAFIRDKAIELLEKEKEQITIAFDFGLGYYENPYDKLEDYYNETYNK